MAFSSKISILAWLGLTFCASCARAQEPFAAPGLRYCAPPIKPACVDDAETYKSAVRKAACKKDVERFVPTVFAYRVCLNQEMERAVSQTNETLQRFRCRETGETRKCP